MNAPVDRRAIRDAWLARSADRLAMTAGVVMVLFAGRLAADAGMAVAAVGVLAFVSGLLGWHGTRTAMEFVNAWIVREEDAG